MRSGTTGAQGEGGNYYDSFEDHLEVYCFSIIRHYRLSRTTATHTAKEIVLQSALIILARPVNTSGPCDDGATPTTSVLVATAWDVPAGLAVTAPMRTLVSVLPRLAGSTSTAVSVDCKVLTDVRVVNPVPKLAGCTSTVASIDCRVLTDVRVVDSVDVVGALAPVGGLPTVAGDGGDPAVLIVLDVDGDPFSIIDKRGAAGLATDEGVEGVADGLDTEGGPLASIDSMTSAGLGTDEVVVGIDITSAEDGCVTTRACPDDGGTTDGVADGERFGVDDGGVDGGAVDGDGF